MKNTELHINFENKTIEMTKAFSKKAKVCASDEYKELVEIGSQFPTYKFVIREVKKSSSKTSRITYKDMERYILAHDPSALVEFNTLRGTDEFAKSASYGSIKKWFVNRFNLNDSSKIDEILASCAA